MSTEFNEPLSRRMLIEYAAKALLGVSLVPVNLLTADDKTPKKSNDQPSSLGVTQKEGSARHVIFLYMNGAMTHLDTFDLKPGQETQGETKGISTNVPGMQFGQTLPELAKLASELAVIRSMHTETGDHEGGRYLLRTSYKEIASIRHPGMGAWALKVLGRFQTMFSSVARRGIPAPGSWNRPSPPFPSAIRMPDCKTRSRRNISLTLHSKSGWS